MAAGSLLLMLLLAGCGQAPESCPAQLPVGLAGAATVSADDALPFRFPLEPLGSAVWPVAARFCDGGGAESGREYHAAEDSLRPAGTPVYAMADGQVSFSGRMGGYGWLIIIDHPQANLYSLYGHLSPSRWRIASGPVEKGELIGYLGDSDENGGSAKHPLRTHLHFGVRAGQRADYSGMGEWRWQAGWIKPCPPDLGWLQPSAIITAQEIPEGGFSTPSGRFLSIWWVELLFGGIYASSGLSMLVVGIWKDRPVLPALSGALLLAAGWVFSGRGAVLGYGLYGLGVLLVAVAVYALVRRFARTRGATRQP